MKDPMSKGRRTADSGSPFRGLVAMAAIAMGLLVCPSTTALAQEADRPKDEALDSLLEKLSQPGDRTDKPGDKTSKGEKKAEEKPKPKTPADKPTKPEASGTTRAEGNHPGTRKPDAPPALTGKDQEIDDLLSKLGETTETPAPDDRRRGGAGDEKTDERRPSPSPDRKERDRLDQKDKETDKHLEELAGRKRRKKDEDNEERSGPAGQIIKEMRDIEQKLTKPDTGEATREEQKKVVKQIETLIEEARKSGQSSMRRMMVRRVRQQGQQRGQQQGQTEGAQAQGAPATKPLKPTSKHADRGGKDIWGHLPPEMRAEIENMINEQPLSTWQELIDRYYLSVGKGKLVREETP